MKVLIVDDDIAERNAVACTLRNAGHDAILASSAPEGVEKFEREKPGAVFVNLLMPYVGGAAAIVDIRKAARRQDHGVYIVVLNGGDIEDARDALAAGADAFVQKPVTKSSVLDALQSVSASTQNR
ncbi:MAG: response regulator [bacterium]|nr:response regulator [bacterium]